MTFRGRKPLCSLDDKTCMVYVNLYIFSKYFSFIVLCYSTTKSVIAITFVSGYRVLRTCYIMVATNFKHP